MMARSDPHRNAKRVETDDGFDWEAFRASVKRVRAIPYREETLDPYEDRDWPDSYGFRAAPYHGWPL
jgi:hypothetical protein